MLYIERVDVEVPPLTTKDTAAPGRLLERLVRCPSHAGTLAHSRSDDAKH